MNQEEYDKAPHLVKMIWLCRSYGTPIGASVFKEAVTRHPEYFPEEAENISRYEAIPMEVHEAYWKDYYLIQEETHKDVPPGKGILGWINDMEGYKEFKIKSDQAREKAKPLHEANHIKHYSKYLNNTN